MTVGSFRTAAINPLARRGFTAQAAPAGHRNHRAVPGRNGGRRRSQTSVDWSVVAVDLDRRQVLIVPTTIIMQHGTGADPAQARQVVIVVTDSAGSRQSPRNSNVNSRRFSMIIARPSLREYSAIIVKDLTRACDIANSFATEHLQILDPRRRQVFGRIRHAEARSH